MRERLVLLFLCLFYILVPNFSAEAATLNKPGNNLGLVGYWAFEDGTSTVATDYSGRGNHGTLTNMSAPATATSGWGSGKTGGGLNFDGINDYVDAGAVTGIHGSTGVTYSAWIYRTGGARYDGIISKFDGSNSIDMLLAGEIAGMDDIFLRVSPTPGSGYAYTTNNVITPNTWHHVVMVYDGTQIGNANMLKLYVNNVQQSLTFIGSVATVAPTVSSNVNIGFYNSTVNYFVGKIDESRIYSRALSLSQVTALYNQGVQRLKVEPTRSGLSVYYPFNDATSTKATDQSGKGNTGTLVNMSTPPTSTSGWGTGKVGGALRFDGVNDYVSLASEFDRTGDNAVSFWVNSSTMSGNIPFFGNQTNPFTYFGHYFSNSSINIYTTTGFSSFAFPTFQTNTWYHIVANRTSGTLRVYVNGVESSTGGVADTANYRIGLIGYYPNTSSYYSGTIDDVRMYNRALTVAEIQTLYRNNLGQKVNASQNVTGTSLDTGLVGLWSFDGRDISSTTAFDRSGSGNNGTLTSGPVAAIGKVGQGLRFDGLDDYVSVSTAPVLSNKPMSVSFWFKGDVSPTNYDGIMGKTTNAGWSDGWGFYFLGSNLYYFIENYAANTAFSAISNPREWNHVVGTWDGTNINIYINGVSGTADTYTGSMTTTPNFAIGRLGTDQFNFKGSIDETRIYNRALTAAEVKLLYNMGN